MPLALRSSITFKTALPIGRRQKTTNVVMWSRQGCCKRRPRMCHGSPFVKDGQSNLRVRARVISRAICIVAMDCTEVAVSLLIAPFLACTAGVKRGILNGGDVR
jgi:hypothetical protein